MTEEDEGKRDWWKIVSVLLFLVVLGNVVVLDYVVGSGRGVAESGIEERLLALEKEISSLTRWQDAVVSQLATFSGETREEGSLSSLTPTSTPQKETVVERVITQIQQTSNVKEFYIPLGSGSVRTENYTWTDTGAEAVFDLSNYTGVKQVTFEATLLVESGDVEARVFNVSDGYAIYGSTLVGSGPQAKLFRSGNLVLHSGQKTYRVQMRTALNYQGVMDNARIKIVVE